MDDGYSGTNFNRPSWSELIEKIENGEVSTLIVKDMSRLGRDYLKVGFYTEVLFVEKGVRFIAINNGIVLYRTLKYNTDITNLSRENTFQIEAHFYKFYLVKLAKIEYNDFSERSVITMTTATALLIKRRF